MCRLHLEQGPVPACPRRLDEPTTTWALLDAFAEGELAHVAAVGIHGGHVHAGAAGEVERDPVPAVTCAEGSPAVAYVTCPDLVVRSRLNLTYWWAVRVRGR
jgi:hypothetical protein